MLKFNIRNQQINRVDNFRPVEKSVSYLMAEFNFMTPEWEPTRNKLICERGEDTYEVPIVGGKCQIPWEVLEGGPFKLCVRGVLGAQVIPTNYLVIDLGATLDDGWEGAEPTLSPEERLQSQIGDLSGLQTSAKENLVSAVNETLAKASEDIGKDRLTEDLQQAVNNANSALQKESDPTVPSWAKAATKPNYTPEEVGADPKGTASAAVSEHNANNSAHPDIRLLIDDINKRINAFFDSEDVNLDQLSELVDYIKNNKDLIDGITTNKISYSDIVDNLVTNVVNKPLSAAQGVALKALVDGLETSKLGVDKLSEGINEALAKAKESGEFDGLSIYVESVQESLEDGGENVVTFTDGSKLTVRNGKTGKTGDTGPGGPQGSPGVDVTHKWNGSILEITSASGTSSSNLIGPVGPQGPQGESGVIAPVNGFFTLAVDADGNLWAYSADGGTAPAFEYDAETGALYVVTEEG